MRNNWTCICAFCLLALPAAALAQQSTLIIRSEAACALTVNAQSQGQLAADTAKAVKVGAGEQLIECQAANGVGIEQTLTVDSGSQKVVILKLAAKLDALQRFSAPGNGTVVDSKSGLQWSQRDNGQNINWNSARSYCGNLGMAGGGWRLPSISELQDIIDGSGSLTTSCGQHACGVSPLFGLTNYWVWSNEPEGASKAWVVYLFSIRGLMSYPVRNDMAPALCVRPRS